MMNLFALNHITNQPLQPLHHSGVRATITEDLTKSNNIWIIKPGENTNRGKGI